MRFSTASFVSAAAAVALAAPAQGERPGWYSNPSISGRPHIGATVFGAPGGIKCDPACVGLVHEWTSCAGAGSAGADRPTGGLPFDGRPAPGCVVRTRGELNYAVRPEDAGRHIQLHVIATNYDCGSVRFSDGSQECRYSSGHGYSATIGPIAASAAPSESSAPGAVAPRNTAPPTLAGPARVSQTLTVSRGSWSGTQPLSFSYQWLRCATALGGCPPISGATTASYTVGARDLGTRIAVIVVASNRAGSAWATAARTVPVVAAGASRGNVVDVRELLPAQRLLIASVAAPTTVRPRGTVVLRVRVTDTRRLLITGATVEVSGQRGEASRTTAKTGSRGEAVLRVKVRSSPRRRTLVLTVRASKSPGDRLAAVKRISLKVRR